MVVQAVQTDNKAIEYIDIPNRVPDEIIENDSLLTIESNMNKLEDRLVLTARSVIGITNEIKIQLFEIERLEKTILSMHRYMVNQSDRILKLEEELEEINNPIEKKSKRNVFGRGIWAWMTKK